MDNDTQENSIFDIIKDLGYTCIFGETLEDMEIVDRKGHKLEKNQRSLFYRSRLLENDYRCFSYCFRDNRTGIEIAIPYYSGVAKIKFGNWLTIDTDANRLFVLYRNEKDFQEYGSKTIAFGYFNRDGDNKTQIYVYSKDNPLGYMELQDKHFVFRGHSSLLDSYQVDDLITTYMEKIKMLFDRYNNSDKEFKYGYNLVEPYIRSCVRRMIEKWQKNLENERHGCEHEKQNAQEELKAAQDEVRKIQERIDRIDVRIASYNELIAERDANLGEQK